MSALAISPVQWSDFQDIDDIEPINDSDFNCLNDIWAVLKKHNRLNRFGVALLHNHFPISDDEILLETANDKNRELTIKPTKQIEAGGNNVGTIWALREGGNIEAMAWCRSYCKRTLFGHTDEHNDED